MTTSASAEQTFAFTASIDESPLAEHLQRFHNAVSDIQRRPLPPLEGRFLYLLVRALKPRCVVDLESGFGPALLYLGAALRDNWGGRVIGSEPSALAHRRAVVDLTAAGLTPYVELRQGSAHDALAINPPLEIDLLIARSRDESIGELLSVVRPSLKPGAVVLGPGGGPARGRAVSLGAQVRESALPWTSLPFPTGLEFAVVD